MAISQNDPRVTSSKPISPSDLSKAKRVYNRYQVKNDDTLSKIALENGVDLSTLVEINPNIKDLTVVPGQIIKIPK